MWRKLFDLIFVYFFFLFLWDVLCVGQKRFGHAAAPLAGITNRSTIFIDCGMLSHASRGPSRNHWKTRNLYSKQVQLFSFHYFERHEKYWPPNKVVASVGHLASNFIFLLNYLSTVERDLTTAGLWVSAGGLIKLGVGCYCFSCVTGALAHLFCANRRKNSTAHHQNG